MEGINEKTEKVREKDQERKKKSSPERERERGGFTRCSEKRLHRYTKKRLIYKIKMVTTER